MNIKNLTYEKNKIVKLFNQKKYKKIANISQKIKLLLLDDIEIAKLIIASEIFLKNYSNAEKYLLIILKNNNTAEFNYLLGNCLKLQEKNNEAIKAFERAIELDSSFSEAYNNLANIQKKIGNFVDAQKNYEKSIKLNKNNLEAYYNLANLFKTNKLYKDSLKNYEMVIKINPNFHDAYNNIGSIYSILGNFNKAKDYFIKAIKINKFFSEPYKDYVQASNITEEDEIFKLLKDLIDNETLQDDQKQTFYYSISKAYFDIKENKLAFHYLNLANEIKLNEVNYSFKNELEEFEKIKNFFDNKKISFKINYNKYSCTPIFILGMPRSGTTLLEQIISNHSKVYGAGELSLLPESIQNSKWDKETNTGLIFNSIRDNYLSKISTISDKKYITDKLPGNFKRIGFIINSLPEAKIIHLERNPMAVCWSNYRSSFNSTGMSFTLSQEYTAQYYVLYKKLIDYWLEKYPEKIININYEKFTENFRTSVKDIFQRLDLNWESNLYDFHKNTRPVDTASFLQVRKKIYKNSSEEWKKYKNYLQPMINILISNNIIF